MWCSLKIKPLKILIKKLKLIWEIEVWWSLIRMMEMRPYQPLTCLIGLLNLEFVMILSLMMLSNGIDQVMKKRKFTVSIEESKQAARDLSSVERVETKPAVRVSTRARVPSSRYSPHEYVLFTDEGEPICYQDAIMMEEKLEWISAMEDEINSLMKNNTYILVDTIHNRKILKNRYKARLVGKGYEQKEGIDFEEIFSPVVKITSIRVVLRFVALYDLEIEQLDVKTAFLHGDLEEVIFMEQPEGFVVEGKEHMVSRLKKCLYGLKQAPRQWYKKFEMFMVEYSFGRTATDPCVFIKEVSSGDFIVLLLYVDDMLIVGKNIGTINELKRRLSTAFEMKDLGRAKNILGMEDRKQQILWLSQKKYILKVFTRFNMESSKPVSCPLDLAYSIGLFSRFLSRPRKENWEAVKWVFRYLKGTSDVSICFGGGEAALIGFTDADMAGDLDMKRSTFRYLFTFAGGALTSWQSRLQKCVALTTTEVEYIAVTKCCKELLWLKKLFRELGI
ncbi:transmembrane signal receptor [Lithospermum erythrorhizon]|uniref:Transmembrane signal receptor n=1 Tax=Lithospermum erythrorhizon TaxID=34254 RepID=A0AAV3PKF9_LITER